MQPDFSTQRLLLSSLTLADDEFILTLLNTPGWLRFIGDRNVRTAEDARAYINKINQNPAFTYWVVKLRYKQTPVGIITFIKRDYLEFPDIGFAFLPAYTKSGYAYEATSVILNYLSKGQLFDHLLAITIPGNIDSIKLLTKLGFELEKETETNGEKLLVYGST
jgi:ribosomal-protein-alanine N-acetyltransferase